MLLKGSIKADRGFSFSCTKVLLPCLMGFEISPYSINRKPHLKEKKLKSKFTLVLDYLNLALNTPPPSPPLVFCVGVENPEPHSSWTSKQCSVGLEPYFFSVKEPWRPDFL